MPKSILIIDDSPEIRKLVRTYFDRETDFQICGEAVDGLDAIEQAVLAVSPRPPLRKRHQTTICGR